MSTGAMIGVIGILLALIMLIAYLFGGDGGCT